MVKPRLAWLQVQVFPIPTGLHGGEQMRENSSKKLYQCYKQAEHRGSPRRCPLGHNPWPSQTLGENRVVQKRESEQNVGEEIQEPKDDHPSSL